MARYVCTTEGCSLGDCPNWRAVAELAARQLDPALIERLRTAVRIARERRFVAVAIDLEDIEALLEAITTA